MNQGNSRRRSSGVLVAIATISVLGTACSVPCVTEEQFRVASPDGKLAAVVFRHDCGATTDFSTQVSVLPAGVSIGNQPGNVFIADVDHNQAPRASWGGPLATVRWRGPRGLVVIYHPLSRVSLEAQSVRVRTGWFRSESIAIEFVRNDGAGPAG